MIFNKKIEPIIEINDSKENFCDEISCDKILPTSSSKIHNRHVVMSSLSCGMGMGLFYASGQQLSCAGAIGVIISYIVVGVMIVFMYLSCCELIACFPHLSLVEYGLVFIDESFGYAISIFYCFNQLIIFPLELISAVMITEIYIDLKKWKWCAISVYAGFVFLLSFLNHKIYAEAEFILNFVKVLTIVLFLIISLAIILGAAGNESFIAHPSSSAFVTPGGFNNLTNGLLIKKIVSIFITSIFSCAGIEYSAMTLLEQDSTNIVKTVKQTSHQIIARIIFFYIIPFILIGALVPYNNKNLLGSLQMIDDPNIPAKSPFALVFELHNIKGLPVIVNIVIILSLISVSNSALHTSSANIINLSQNSQLPKCLSKISKGKPIRSILIAASFEGLAYLIYLPDSEQVFTYMVSIGGLSTILLWTSICISQIKFRSYAKKNNIYLKDLKYKTPTGTVGSYIAVIINMSIFCLTFWTSLWPVGTGTISISNFLKIYSGVPFFITLFIGHKIYQKLWKKKKFFSCINDNDIRRQFEHQQAHEIIAEKSSPLRDIELTL
ncbi:hypothetical protein QEN19_001401 [Hanseniaspora menglaensis]